MAYKFEHHKSFSMLHEHIYTSETCCLRWLLSLPFCYYLLQAVIAAGEESFKAIQWLTKRYTYTDLYFMSNLTGICID